MTVTLKEKLEAADARAQVELSRMKEPDVSRSVFEECIRRYVQAKFFLEPEECTSDDILKLADISVEKLLKANDKTVKLSEAESTCTNQSSTEVKKVLLSLTLQRALGVKFSPDESAALETIKQFADALYEKLNSERAA